MARASLGGNGTGSTTAAKLGSKKNGNERRSRPVVFLTRWVVDLQARGGGGGLYPDTYIKACSCPMHDSPKRYMYRPTCTVPLVHVPPHLYRPDVIFSSMSPMLITKDPGTGGASTHWLARFLTYKGREQLACSEEGWYQ